MYEDIKIFIPTKGRINNQKTYKILKEIGLEPILVVEPQEYFETFQKGFKCVSLEENNQGITYSRNFILDLARKNKYEYICMIDDDISQFGFIENHKRVPNNNAFLSALEHFKKFNMCGTMQYNQFAWCQEKPIVYNRGIEVVMFLYMPQIKNKYFEEDTIEDRDFSLDIILNNDSLNNVKTFRLNHHYFTCPSIGTNKGDIESQTRNYKQIKWSQKMEEKWGSEICKYVIKKNGTPDIKINWRTIDKIIKNKNIQLSFPLYPQDNMFKKTKEEKKYTQLQFPFMKDFQEV